MIKESVYDILKKEKRIDNEVLVGQLCNNYFLNEKIISMMPKLPYDIKRFINIALCNNTINEVEYVILNSSFPPSTLKKVIMFIISTPKKDLKIDIKSIYGLELNGFAIIRLLKICNYGINILKWVKPKMSPSSIHELFLAKIQGLNDEQMQELSELSCHKEINIRRREIVGELYKNMLKDRYRIFDADLQFI